MTAPGGPAWVDLAMLAVLAFSVILGLWRGLVFEVVSLAGWVVAYMAANLAGPMVAGLIPGTEDSASLRLWGAYVGVFIVALVACTLLARLLRMIVSATPLSVVDRLGGGAFGAARALVLGLVVATLVTLSPFAQARAWQDSYGRTWLSAALQFVRPLLPDSLGAKLPGAA